MDEIKKTNKKIVMTGLMIGTFLTAIEGTVVSTAMPKIVADLQGITIMGWVFSVFMLTSAVTVPLFGKMADLFGRKRVFVVGTLIFLLGSVMCGLSWSMSALIVARAIQGIGTGAIMTLSTTIIGDIYPQSESAKMFGLIGSIWGIAGIFGPLVGGFFVDTLSWHWIFFINLPFGILSVLFVVAGLQEMGMRQKQKIDIAGAAAFAVSMIALLYGIQAIGDQGFVLHWPIIASIAVVFLFGTLFVWIERRQADPLMSFHLLSRPIILLTNFIALASSAVLIGNDIYLPMWLQGMLGYSATASGFVLTPMSLAWMAGSFLCGRLLRRYGIRFTGLTGAVLIAIGSFWMSSLRPSSFPLQMYAMTAILGIGFGMVLTLTTICVQSAVDFEKRGAATASNQFFRSIGQTIGAALLGSSFNGVAEGTLAKQHNSALSLHSLNQLIHPSGQTHFASQALNVLRSALYEAIHHIFILLFLLALLIIILAALLPKRVRAARKKADATSAASAQNV
ncbi:MAG: MDR family MFS transporter [Sporolactobacillus sp.]